MNKWKRHNGVREPGEQCDDGNGDDGDGCSARCLNPVSELLAFYDSSVMAGTLVGSGPGNSAGGRTGALRNQLDAMARNFDERATRRTCQQLASILRRADGVPKPPDFVAGAATPELASNIKAVQADLGCVSQAEAARSATSRTRSSTLC